MTFYTREPHRFTDDEIGFLMTLAGQAAIGIYNARLHDEVKKHVGELEKANKVKSELLSVMPHELRTPLNIIMGYTGLVQGGMLGEIKLEQSEALGKALNHSFLGFTEHDKQHYVGDADRGSRSQIRKIYR